MVAQMRLLYCHDFKSNYQYIDFIDNPIYQSMLAHGLQSCIADIMRFKRPHIIQHTGLI